MHITQYVMLYFEKFNVARTDIYKVLAVYISYFMYLSK